MDSGKGPRATKTNKKNTKQKKSIVEIRKEELINEKKQEPISAGSSTSLLLPRKKSRPIRKTKQTKKNEQLLKKRAELEVAKLEIRPEKEPSVRSLPAHTYNDFKDVVVVLERLQDLREKESIEHLDRIKSKINVTDNLNEADKSSTAKSKNEKNINRCEIDVIIEQYDEEKCTQNSSKKPNNKFDSFDKKTQSSSRYSTRNKNKRIDLPNLKTDKALVIDDEVGSTVNYRRMFDSPTKKKLETIEKKRRSKSSRSSSSIQSNCVEHVKVNAVIEHNSLSTVRKSPINGHGDSEISDCIGPGTGAKHRVISNNPVFCPKSPSDVSKRSRSSNKKAKSTTSEQVNRSKIQSSISPTKLSVTKTKATSDDSCVNKIRSIISTETSRKRQNEPVVEIESKRSKLESIVGRLSKQGDKSGEKSEVSEERGVIVRPNVSLNISENEASTSIKSWLKQSLEVLSCLPREDFEIHMYKESIKMIMEKLNTCLVDIHHDTTLKLSQLNEELQKRLDETSDRRNQLFAGTMQLIQDKLKECDDKSKDMDKEMRKHLKEHTSLIISEDASKKQQFFNLLKQEILSNIPNNRETK